MRGYSQGTNPTLEGQVTDPSGAVQVLQGIAINYRLIVGLLESLHYDGNAAEMRAKAKPAAGPRCYPRIAARWQRALALFSFQRRPMPLPKPRQQTFNVLAGTERTDREIRGGTIVLEERRPAHGDAVSLWLAARTR